MDIKDIVYCHEQSEDFRLFQEFIFYTLQKRGHFLTDITLDDLTEDAQEVFFNTAHQIWSEVVHYKVLNRKLKKVMQLDLQTGQLIAIFPSAAAAGRSVKGDPTLIRAICRGLWDSAYGYTWRYVEV